MDSVQSWRAAGLFAAVLVATAAQAGVVDGVKSLGGLTVYLGVVPAAVVQRHPADHSEASMHGGVPSGKAHAKHLLVAVFDQRTGKRITNATVIAHILEDGGKAWSVPLQPMTINGAVTYGGYTSLASAADYAIGVRVYRHLVRGEHPVQVHFTWTHD